MITVGPLTPNYLTVNPDGTIGADFTGHVKASGLDLGWGSSRFGSTNMLSWLDNFNQRQAFLLAYNDTNAFEDQRVELFYNGPGNGLGIRLAFPLIGAEVARILLLTPNRTSVRLMDDNGVSDFLQKANNLSEVAARLQAANNLSDLADLNTARTNLGIRWGAVTATGAVSAGTGFTVTKGTTGLYTLNWNTPFSSGNYAMVLTSITGTVGGLVGGQQFAGSCQVGMNVSTTGALIDRFFEFIAIG